MKRSDIFILSRLTLVFLIVIPISSKANAEVVYELGKPPPPLSSAPPQSNPGKGSAEGLMLRSLSKLFMSFEALEQGKIQKAEELLDEVRAALWEAAAFFEDFHKCVGSQIPNLPISTANITNDEIRIIKKDFKLYGLEIPENYKDLAYSAYEAVKDFAQFMDNKSFKDDSAKNRKTIREILAGLNRYIRLGISISEIHAANPLPK